MGPEAGDVEGGLVDGALVGGVGVGGRGIGAGGGVGAGRSVGGEVGAGVGVLEAGVGAGVIGAGVVGAVVVGVDVGAGDDAGVVAGAVGCAAGAEDCEVRGCAQLEHHRASARFCVPQDGQRSGRSSDMTLLLLGLGFPAWGRVVGSADPATPWTLPEGYENRVPTRRCRPSSPGRS